MGGRQDGGAVRPLQAGRRPGHHLLQLLGEDEFRVFEPANDVEWAKIPKLPYMVFVIDELADP